MRPWANIEITLTKPKMNPKKADEIRSMMARVGAEPERVTRDCNGVNNGVNNGVMSARDTPPF